VSPGEAIALVTGVVGLAGVLFTALRFRREDTSAVVSTQSQILLDMKALNDELRVTADSLKKERDELRGQVEQLRSEVNKLSVDLRVANARIEGKVEGIRERLDET
jgi:uncharacterized coiled-coil DUF342 family protein